MKAFGLRRGQRLDLGGFSFCCAGIKPNNRSERGGIWEQHAKITGSSECLLIFVRNMWIIPSFYNFHIKKSDDVFGRSSANICKSPRNLNLVANNQIEYATILGSDFRFQPGSLILPHRFYLSLPLKKVDNGCCDGNEQSPQGKVKRVWLFLPRHVRLLIALAVVFFWFGVFYFLHDCTSTGSRFSGGLCALFLFFFLYCLPPNLLMPYPAYWTHTTLFLMWMKKR